jgi:hypothetical protein
MGYTSIIKININKKHPPKVDREKLQKFIEDYNNKHDDAFIDAKFEVDNDGNLTAIDFIEDWGKFYNFEDFAHGLSKAIIEGKLEIFLYGEDYGDWSGMLIGSNLVIELEPIFAPMFY